VRELKSAVARFLETLRAYAADEEPRRVQDASDADAPEFVWSESMYRVKKAAEEFSEAIDADGQDATEGGTDAQGGWSSASDEELIDYCKRAGQTYPWAAECAARLERMIDANDVRAAKEAAADPVRIPYDNATVEVNSRGKWVPRPVCQLCSGEATRFEEIQLRTWICTNCFDEHALEPDDELVESDYEWLEERGFSVDWDNDEGTGWHARIEVTSHIWIQVSEQYGSTALIWRAAADRELHLGIDDNATRGDVLRLCTALGVDLCTPEPDATVELNSRGEETE